MSAFQQVGYHAVPSVQEAAAGKGGATAHAARIALSQEDVTRAPSKSQQHRSGASNTAGFLARLEDWWVLELLGVIISAGALAAIVGILYHYHGTPQPTWRNVSLNTMISWLSTLANVMVLIPVTSGLSQLKWVWFAGKRRTMSDRGYFDSASRGVIGSLALIFEQQGRHFAGLAALATILAVGFDPFIQNLVHYTPEPAEHITVPAYVTYSADYNINGIPASASQLGASHVYWIDSVMKANVYSSLLNTDKSQAWSIPQFDCATGNCTWDPIATLAMMMAKGSNSNSTALAFGNSISNASTIFATECAFQICVQSVRPRVSSGVYYEEEVDWWCDFTLQTMPTNYSLLHKDNPVGWRRLELSPPWGLEHGMQSGQTFGIASSSLSSLAGFIQGIFAGSSMYAAQGILRSIFYGNISGCADEDDHLICAANNAAKAMTKTLRDSAFVASRSENTTMARGRTLIMVNFVRIQWVWIALPALVWLLALVTWVGTLLKSSRARVPRWRDDILPLLFLYREGEEGKPETSGASQSSAEVAKSCTAVEVQLRAEDLRYRLL
ncbi:hypothetical protein CBER1_07664 [Cercospora berteroae]|uniref:Uncharacterized protein n=1 Tax=Cercospora berteroae TaxID=357750 RepID=A0A2S6C4J7_9PEZI|nr:hypothetical protein CBER1_07664 [Cercospora berteroae]